MMDSYWPPLPLTESLRPVLLDQEVELLTCPQVSIYFGDTKSHRSGVATVTSHRLLWMNNAKKPTFCCALSHALVVRLESKTGFLGVSSPKITLYLKGLPLPQATAAPASASASSSAPAAPVEVKLAPVPAPGYVQLSFHGSHKTRDDCFGVLESALHAAAWISHAEAKQAAVKTAGFSTSQAGIQGIVRTVKQTQQNNEKAVDEAFGDLKALMGKAKDMVALVSKYTGALEAKQKKDEDPSDAESDNKEQENQQFNAILFNMGIPSPVTRVTAGDQYHLQLARQLADFLKEPLKRAGGVMTLTDVFCVFNRARGTELVSPDDLQMACKEFGELGLPVKLRTFESGVCVIQSEDHSDKATALRILKIIQDVQRKTLVVGDEVKRVPAASPSDSPRSIMSSSSMRFGPGTNVYLNMAVNVNQSAEDAVAALGMACMVGLSALDLSQAMNISVILAKQHLINAEQMELLCRDHSVQGLRFHANLFLLKD